VARSGPLEEPVPSTPRLRDKIGRYLLYRESIPDLLPEEDIFCMLNRSQISVLDRDGSFDSFAEARPLGGRREARPALDSLPLWCRRSRCPDFGAPSESRPVRSGQSDRSIHSNAMLASPGGDTKCARGLPASKSTVTSEPGWVSLTAQAVPAGALSAADREPGCSEFAAE
jgi:hypothetical protein